MDEIPEEVRRAYEAEIQRLEGLLKGASQEEALHLREAIGDLEAELLVEAWPTVD